MITTVQRGGCMGEVRAFEDRFSLQKTAFWKSNFVGRLTGGFLETYRVKGQLLDSAHWKI